MSRPYKTGIDYFSLDVDIDQDDKIFIIEAELGELAFGRLIKLLAEIYKSGYFKKWSEEDALIFAGKKKLPIDEVKTLVETAIKRGFFDQNLYEQYNILTSAGIQKRYIKACENRQRILIEKKYKLFDTEDFNEKIKSKLEIVNPGINKEIPELTAGIPETIPQKKREDNKVKEKNAEYIPLASFLADKIEENDPKHFHNKNKTKKAISWANDIRLLVEQDGRDREEIKAVIIWCQENYFWKSNILSGSKLRKQFPKLLMQMNRGKPRASPPPRPPKICPSCQRQIIGTQASCSGCGLPVKDFNNGQAIEEYRKMNGTP